MFIRKMGLPLDGAAWLGLTLLVLATLCPNANAARDGNYLIITPPSFDNTAALNQFIADRASKGFNVMKYVVPAGTTKETIKSYIVGLWGTADAPQYILLVGDTSGTSPSTSSTLPNWVGTASRHGDSDMYYAVMPGGIDWYPDIAIGRFSVTTPAMLQNVVNKTLFVEAGIFPDPDYTRRGAFLANPDTAGLAEPTHDFVINNYFAPLGYQGIRIYSAQGGTTAMVRSALNSGVMFCVYMGHSADGGWWDPAFGQSDVNNLTNTGMYPLVFGWSCNTAHYTYTECCGETWLRAANKGAAAYISASNYIFWGGYNEWLPSAHHEKAFFNAFFDKDIWEVGPAWRQGLYTFLATYGGWDGDMNHQPPNNLDYCKNFVEEFVLLGDPALLIPRQALRINLLSEIPDHVAPGVATTIKVQIQDAGESYVPGSGLLYYCYEDGDFLSTPLAPAGGTNFDALLPPTACGDHPRFYFQAEGDGGAVVNYPSDAPANSFSIIVGTPAQVIDDNFETDLGWVTENLGATAGDWERGVPVNDPSYVYDPPADSDGSGQCYLTGNYLGNSDIDNGAVRLTSPTIDMSKPGATISYDYYLYLTYELGDDLILVEINTNDGAGTWTEIARHDTTGGTSWRHHEITPAQLAALGITTTATTKVRFTANDGGTQSIVEAGIDAFKVLVYECDEGCYGDLNGDNNINLNDLAVLLANYGAADPAPEDGDLDEDGDVDLTDLAGLLAVYGTSCP